MTFVLRGFAQVKEFRVFAFDGISEDRSRAPYTVRADLALSASYGIRLQELPLLCKRLLDQKCDNVKERAFTFTEAAMREYAGDLALAREAAKNRKPPKRPEAGQAASPWRGPSVR
jgi:hypothetical protein